MLDTCGYGLATGGRALWLGLCQHISIFEGYGRPRTVNEASFSVSVCEATFMGGRASCILFSVFNCEFMRTGGRAPWLNC